MAAESVCRTARWQSNLFVAQSKLANLDLNAVLLPLNAEEIQDRTMQGSRYSRDGASLLQSPSREHRVVFYSRDRALLEAAAEFLTPVVKQRQKAVVLAGREHRAEIQKRLKSSGVDVDAELKAGRYIEVDPEEFLSQIVLKGKPDPKAFARIMERLMSQAGRAAKGGAAVFNGVISLLCARGQGETAVELEHLWNELARRYDFALLCGYSARDFSGSGHNNNVYAGICAAHSDVLPEEGYLELDDEGRLRYIAELQQEVRALNSALEGRPGSEEALARSEKLAAMGRMAASIAHEINSPLTTLTNIIYLLGTHKSLDPEARHYVEMADQELRRTSRITKQVLGFYRESAAAVEFKIFEIVNDVLELFEPKLRKASISVERDYRIEGTVKGYPSEIRQVFANLIANAIDAIGSRGKICVRVSSARDLTMPGHCGVQTAIGDSGPGISQENQRFVFHPFFTTKGESGTGLGLWLSSGIIRRHGGRMRVRSRVHRERHGTVFTVFLPGADQPGVQPPKTQENEPWKLAA